MWLYISDKNERLPLNLVSKLYRLVLFRVPVAYCQTPLQLADPTQLQLVGVGVDFVFPLEESTYTYQPVQHILINMEPTPSY